MLALNNRFRKTPEALITYTSPGGRDRQIDYFLATKSFAKLCSNCNAGQVLDLGSDHRAVKAEFKKSNRTAKKTPPRKKRESKAAWPPANIDEYTEKMEIYARDIDLKNSLVAKCNAIEDSMLEASRHCQQSEHDHGQDDYRNGRSKASSLNGRDSHQKCAERQQLSKKIQKEIKMWKKLVAESQIDKLMCRWLTSTC